MICNFHVGQRVVCIGDFTVLSNEEWAVLLEVRFPAVGTVYTIREMRPGINGDEEESVGLILDEIENPEVPTATVGGTDIDQRRTKLQEPSFDCRGFAPLVESRADISQFKALLNSQPEQVPA